MMRCCNCVCDTSFTIIIYVKMTKNEKIRVGIASICGFFRLFADCNEKNT